MPMLETNRLSVRYGTKTIVDSLSFSVSEGQWLMIVGPNGAGKSTALSAITQGAPYTGSVLFEGQDVKKMKSALRAQAIGVLSQNHFVGYGFTVEEVVRLGRFAYSGGLLGRSQTEDAKHVEHALTLTGMQDKRQQFFKDILVLGPVRGREDIHRRAGAFFHEARPGGFIEPQDRVERHPRLAARLRQQRIHPGRQHHRRRSRHHGAPPQGLHRLKT